MKGHRARLTLVLGLVSALLVLAVTACSSAEEPAADSGDQAEETASEEATPVAEADGEHWLNGLWDVEFTLVSVDPDADWARAAADQPYAQWDCTVEDGELTIAGGTASYIGPLIEDGDSWSFEASGEFVDDEGTTWTSHIILDGQKQSEVAFIVEQWGEISSDADGVLYEAVWSAIGTKVE